MDHGNSKNSEIFTNIFFQFLNGFLGGEDDERFSSNIVHLVLAGSKFFIYSLIDTFAPSKTLNSKSVDVRGVNFKIFFTF